MFLKIMTFVTIARLADCAGEAEGHRYAQAAPAVSSAVMHREDVPLSYKYNIIHTHTTPKTEERYVTQFKQYQPSSPKSQHFRSMQYAPLQPGEVRIGNGLFTKLNPQNSHDNNPNRAAPEEPKIEKKPLEPVVENKLPTSLYPHPLSHLEYIPGHNVEVLRSVNRSPGHNAVYKSYGEVTPTVEKKKVNFLNQYIIHPSARELKFSEIYSPSSTEHYSTVTAATTTTTSSTTQKTPLLAYAGNPYLKTYRVVESPSLTLQQSKQPYTKMHALLLNVARIYNMAPGPYKGLHMGANPAIFNYLPENQQGHVKAPRLAQNHYKVPQQTSWIHPQTSDKKSVLFPVDSNRHYVLHT